MFDNSYPDAPCMEYESLHLPHFHDPNVAKYCIHEAYGIGIEIPTATECHNHPKSSIFPRIFLHEEDVTHVATREDDADSRRDFVTTLMIFPWQNQRMIKILGIIQ